MRKLLVILALDMDADMAMGFNLAPFDDDAMGKLNLLRAKYAYRRQGQGILTGPETQRMLFYRWLYHRGALNEGESHAQESESA